MSVLSNSLDTAEDAYRLNREAMLIQITQHDDQLAVATAGGGANYVERHRRRGKMLVR